MQKIGILGGGQLGRMLLQAAANYPVETFVMENDPACPAAHLCHHFTKGDIKNFDDVYRFGQGLDMLTIEIENVNVDALEKLEAEGLKIFPKPSVLRTIKNKIRDKPVTAITNFLPTDEVKNSDHFINQCRAQKFYPKDRLWRCKNSIGTSNEGENFFGTCLL